MQCRQERRLRTFLVDRAPADDAPTQARLVHQGRVEGRRRPFRGIDLFDVIHEVDTDGSGSTGVERGEDTGLSVGGNFCNAVESGVAQHAHGEVAAFVHAAVLGGNRRLANPLLQTDHGFVVAFLDFFLDGAQVRAGIGSERVAGKSKSGGAGGSGLKESASVHGREDNWTG